MPAVLKIFLFALALSVLALPAGARDDCIARLPIRNQMPTAAIFLELTGLSPCVIPEGGSQFVFGGQYSNTSMGGEENDAVILIDSERFDGHVLLRFGLPWRSDLALRFGFVRDGAGFMDSLIRQFHELTDSNSGNRADRADGLYEYTQQWTNSGAGFSLTDPPQGASEPVVTFRHQAGEFGLWRWREVIWGWRLALKLPLPDSSPAIGSGRLDFGGGLLLDGLFHSPWGALHTFADVGIVHLGETEATVFPIHEWVPMGGAGFALPLSSRWSLLAQWQLSAARYPYPPLHKLARPQSIFAIAGNYRTEGGLLSFGITEDPTIASEDFGLFVFYRTAAPGL